MPTRIERRRVADLVPYPNNPRIIRPDDVEKVAASIEAYGYQSPIIVDVEGVIVAGHARHAALRRLGVDEVAVLVMDEPPEKVARYRVLDNRTGELTTWDPDLLIAELREFTDVSRVALFFPDVDLTLAYDTDLDLGDSDLARAQADLDSRFAGQPADTVEVGCPHCGHAFDVTRVRR